MSKPGPAKRGRPAFSIRKAHPLSTPLLQAMRQKALEQQRLLREQQQEKIEQLTLTLTLTLTLLLPLTLTLTLTLTRPLPLPLLLPLPLTLTLTVNLPLTRSSCLAGRRGLRSRSTSRRR